MPAKNINHLAVWVGAIVFFFWGYVFWGLIFKAQALAMAAQTNAPTTPLAPLTYVGMFVMALILGYGTAIALSDSSKPGASHGISFGLFMGVVFFASTRLTQTLAQQHPLSWWVLEVCWALIGFALVGAIVGGWSRKAATA